MESNIYTLNVVVDNVQDFAVYIFTHIRVQNDLIFCGCLNLYLLSPTREQVGWGLYQLLFLLLGQHPDLAVLDATPT